MPKALMISNINVFEYNMILMKLVIKIGGSLSIDEDGPKVEYFRKIIPVLKRLGKEHQLVLSIGGGKFIRKYYSAIEKLGLSHEKMEWIAIELLRVNVRFLSFLTDMKPIYTLEELNSKSSGVIGGIKPGRSTDANAAYAASMIKADYFIKLTDVEGVYDKDPKLHKDVIKLGFIPFGDLVKFSQEGSPGSYGVLDKLAVETIAKHRIKTIIMNGSEPENMLRAVKGERIGTLIA